MIIKNIVQIGNPILRKKSKIVSNINDKAVRKTITDLVDTMRAHNLIGIAASQIGKKERIFVTEVRKTKYRNENLDELRVYINPVIVWSSKQQEIIYEGCGSVAYANLFGPVKRPKSIIIKAQDINGDFFSFKTDGMLARVIQHEYDHLNGVEFTEKITDIKKIMSSGEFVKLKK